MRKSILIWGDIFTIALVTVIGFASHGESGTAFLPRMAAAFFPLVFAWFLLAPWFGLFQAEVVHDARQLWRPVLAAIFAGPLAAVARGFSLNAPVIPVFALVLSVTCAFGLVVWRGIYLLLKRNFNGRQENSRERSGL